MNMEQVPPGFCALAASSRYRTPVVLVREPHTCCRRQLVVPDGRIVAYNNRTHKLSPGRATLIGNPLYARASVP